MKWSLCSLAAIAGISFIGEANATTITYSSRPIVSYANSSAADYKQDWLDAYAAAPVAPSGYGDATFSEFWAVSNQSQGQAQQQGFSIGHDGLPSNNEFVGPSSQNIGGTNGNLSEHFGLKFSVDSSDVGVWGFRFQNDFGYGGSVFVNGTPVAFKNSNLGGFDPQDIFYLSALLSSGTNIIDIYGQEDCCDGYAKGHFMKPGDQKYTVFSSKDHISAVPLPPSILFMLSGLVTLVAFRRRETKPF